MKRYIRSAETKDMIPVEEVKEVLGDLVTIPYFEHRQITEDDVRLAYRKLIGADPSEIL